jgi:hypothetical protein
MKIYISDTWKCLISAYNDNPKLHEKRARDGLSECLRNQIGKNTFTKTIADKIINKGSFIIKEEDDWITFHYEYKDERKQKKFDL